MREAGGWVGSGFHMRKPGQRNEVPGSGTRICRGCSPLLARKEAEGRGHLFGTQGSGGLRGLAAWGTRLPARLGTHGLPVPG